MARHKAQPYLIAAKSPLQEVTHRAGTQREALKVLAVIRAAQVQLCMHAFLKDPEYSNLLGWKPKKIQSTLAFRDFTRSNQLTLSITKL